MKEKVRIERYGEYMSLENNSFSLYWHFYQLKYRVKDSEMWNMIDNWRGSSNDNAGWVCEKICQVWSSHITL